MFKWIKRKVKQITCKHLFISDKPFMDFETWDMVNVCGKCGRKIKFHT
ncbi:hypothetical protein [Heyndrickxia camelliae]|nr:hypothetical protein [Heyndrickxia camelliae]